MKYSINMCAEQVLEQLITDTYLDSCSEQVVRDTIIPHEIDEIDDLTDDKNNLQSELQDLLEKIGKVNGYRASKEVKLKLEELIK